MSVTNLVVSVENSTDVGPKEVQLDYKNSDFDPIDDLDLFAEDAEHYDDDGETNEKSAVNFNVIIDAEKVVPPNVKRYVNPLFADKSTAFLSTEESKAKKHARAARFGIENETKNSDVINLDDKIVENLLKSYNINAENVRDKQKFRLNSLYVRGVQEMSTDDIFHYFNRFSPHFIEWINDFSCNVVWENKDDAVRALLNCSKPIKKVQPKKDTRRKFDDDERKIEDDDDEELEEGEEEKNVSPLKRTDIATEKIKTTQENDEEMVEKNDDEEGGILGESYVLVDATKHTIPPGHWRVGDACEKSDLILVRFSTIEDVKLRNAERESVFYKKYGNPNFGNSVGLISTSRKRKLLGRPSRFRHDYDEPEDEDDDRRRTDLRQHLKKSHRWAEIRASNRRSSDEEDLSPYSDDDDDDRRRPKRFRMQMRADDVERKMRSRRTRRENFVVTKPNVDDEPEEGEILDDDEDEREEIVHVRDERDDDDDYHDFRRRGFDLRERLRKFRMKITVDNSTAGDDIQLPDMADD